MKQRLNICVDADVYLAVKTKLLPQHLSGTVNNLLREFLRVNDAPGKVANIEEELEVTRREILERQEKMSLLSVRLVQAREEEAQRSREHEEQLLAVHEAALHNNPLRFS